MDCPKEGNKVKLPFQFPSKQRNKVLVLIWNFDRRVKTFTLVPNFLEEEKKLYFCSEIFFKKRLNFQVWFWIFLKKRNKLHFCSDILQIDEKKFKFWSEFFHRRVKTYTPVLNFSSSKEEKKVAILFRTNICKICFHFLN